jgi:hypothetical protein
MIRSDSIVMRLTSLLDEHFQDDITEYDEDTKHNGQKRSVGPPESLCVESEGREDYALVDAVYWSRIDSLVADGTWISSPN